MQTKYGYPESKTGILVTIPYLVCGITMIPIGLLTDQYGWRQTVINFAGTFLIATFGLFLLLPPSQETGFITVLPWFLLGVNQSVYYVLQWGCLPYMVKPDQISTAYGLITCLQNLGCTVLPPVISYLHDSNLESPDSYRKSMMTMLVMAVVSFILKILLKIWDNTVRGGILEKVNAFEVYIQWIQ